MGRGGLDAGLTAPRMRRIRCVPDRPPAVHTAGVLSRNRSDEHPSCGRQWRRPAQLQPQRLPVQQRECRLVRMVARLAPLALPSYVVAVYFSLFIIVSCVVCGYERGLHGADRYAPSFPSRLHPSAAPSYSPFFVFESGIIFCEDVRGFPAGGSTASLCRLRHNRIWF